MLNIDAFLHQVDSATSALTSVAEESRVILKSRVYQTISDIASMTLFDEELATSRPWVRNSAAMILYMYVLNRSTQGRSDKYMYTQVHVHSV